MGPMNLIPPHWVLVVTVTRPGVGRHVSLTPLTFQMTVAPDASEQEVAYAEKWRYIIQLRYA